MISWLQPTQHASVVFCDGRPIASCASPEAARAYLFLAMARADVPFLAHAADWSVGARIPQPQPVT